MVDAAHVAEVGPAAAILYARILWRAERDGQWEATKALLARETGLTPGMLRTATQVLRDRGWVTATRKSSDDPTLVWAPVVAGQAVNVDLAPPPCEIRTTPPAESAFTSTQTVGDLETTTPPPVGVGVSEDAPLPMLVLVPDPPVAQNATTNEVPPQTAQTLVARWVDGYRDHNDGQDPHPALIRRVAGQSKNLAKTCATDADWGAAWRASYDAGRAGAWDAVRFLPKPQAPRGRVNHDLERLQARQVHPAYGGAVGSPAATALAMLGPSTRQEDR